MSTKLVFVAIVGQGAAKINPPLHTWSKVYKSRVELFESGNRRLYYSFFYLFALM